MRLRFGMHGANRTLNITETITKRVNKFLKEVTQESIVEKMELHYKVLGLMDSDGDWVSKYFKTGSNGQYFLPRNNITSEDLILLVNKMAANVEKNAYIINVFEHLQKGNYQKLERKLKGTQP